MKKLFFTFAILLGSLTMTQAQEVGQMWVGGSVGIWSSKTKGIDETATSYKIMPEIGYVVSENIGIGLNFGYAHNESISNSVTNAKVKTDGYTVSPFVRFSFLKGDLGALFVDATAGYSYLNEKKTSTKTNQFEVGLRPGIAFNVSDRISLIGKFGFLGYQYTKVGDTKNNSFGLDLDMSQIQLGACLKF